MNMHLARLENSTGLYTGYYLSLQRRPEPLGARTTRFGADEPDVKIRILNNGLIRYRHIIETYRLHVSTHPD
jgi:hypothetical protein